MRKLKVKFGKPLHGWMEVNISTVAQEVIEDVATCRYTFSSLISALYTSLDKQHGSMTSAWPLEPDDLELIFERDDKGCCVKVNSPQRVEFVCYGTYEEICLPFWRALRGLETRYSSEELAERIGENFPVEEMGKLTAAIKLLKQR